jgi:hypothetical protein
MQISLIFISLFFFSFFFFGQNTCSFFFFCSNTVQFSHSLFFFFSVFKLANLCFFFLRRQRLTPTRPHDSIATTQRGSFSLLATEKLIVVVLPGSWYFFGLDFMGKEGEGKVAVDDEEKWPVLLLFLVAGEGKSGP